VPVSFDKKIKMEFTKNKETKIAKKLLCQNVAINKIGTRSRGRRPEVSKNSM
jgi:hypothetical protein